MVATSRPSRVRQLPLAYFCRVGLGCIAWILTACTPAPGADISASPSVPPDARPVRPAITAGSPQSPAQALATGGAPTDSGSALPGQAVPIQGADHIAQGAAHAPYNSKPATSGPHWSLPGEGPVPWGIYQDPIPEEAQVHNLEHGGVIISHRCRDCPELVAQLEALYARYTAANPLPRYPASTKIIVAPYPDMPTRIALTAWGRIDAFEAYDESRILRFIAAFRDNGPEAVP